MGGYGKFPVEVTPQRWSEDDLAFIEIFLDEEHYTYTTQQLANHLY